VLSVFISRFIFQYRIQRMFSSHVTLPNEVFTIVSVYYIPLSLLFLGWFCGNTSHWEQQGQNFQSKDFYRTVMVNLSRHPGKAEKLFSKQFLLQNTHPLKTTTLTPLFPIHWIRMFCFLKKNKQLNKKWSSTILSRLNKRKCKGFLQGQSKLSVIMWCPYYVGVLLVKVCLFLDGEGWGILVFFSKRRVGPPLC